MTVPQRPIHFVQVGFDESVFHDAAPSDTLKRQFAYRDRLAQCAPGSKITMLILSSRGQTEPVSHDGLRLEPVPMLRYGRLDHLPDSLEALHRRNPIDVIATQTVHTETEPVLSFAERSEVPVIGHIHYDLFEAHARLDHFGRSIPGWWRFRNTCRRLRRFAALRTDGRRTAEEILHRRLHDNVRWLPLPALIDPADSTAVPARAGQGEQPSHVLFIGRLVPQKNLFNWLRVAELVHQAEPTARFDVIGDGPLRNRLERYAARAGLADMVHFHGWVAHDRLADFFSHSAALLLSSWYEGLPRVPIESYRHGVPVVGTCISGVEDTLEHGRSGFLHEPTDIEGMARSVLALLRDDHQRQQMADAGREIVNKRFDPQELINSNIEMVLTVANAPKLASRP